MKKLIFIFMIAAVLVSCKKNTTNEPTPVNQQTQEVTFDITTILESPDRAYSVPNCIPEIDNEFNKYAEILIEDASGVQTTYFAEIYYVEGLPYTKAIMLPVTDDDDDCDTYRLIEFYVWDNNQSPGYIGTPGTVPAVDPRDDDILFKAAPLPGSDFWDFAVNRVFDPQAQEPQEFEVCAFFKTKILIDVLCFVPDYYDLFGFFWFEITEITVREICFFGDFCLKDTDIYANTIYGEDGIFIDEAAVFEIRAKHQVGDGPLEDMVGTPFNNWTWRGVGEPLCIRYPDYDAFVDHYEWELYLWAMVGNQMGWVYLYTFTWDDIFTDTYPTGPFPEEIDNDGVYEFVVGNCVASETDMLFPPYMNIPATGTMHLYAPANPGLQTGAYWDVMFSGFGSGYDIIDGHVYPGWCGDYNTTINYGDHIVDFFTTLDPVAIMPGPSHLTDAKLQQLNYLFNHFDSNGLNMYPLGLFGPEFTTIQQSIWGVVHSTDGSTPWAPSGTDPLAVSMATDALMYGVGYEILPGGDAGVLAFEYDDLYGMYVSQLILIVVDP